MEESTKILVELLDEATPVWGLLEAVQQEDGAFIICEQPISEDEHWRFSSGDTVIAEMEIQDGKEVWVAVKLAEWEGY